MASPGLCISLGVEVLAKGKFRVGEHVGHTHSAGCLRATGQRYGVTILGPTV